MNNFNQDIRHRKPYKKKKWTEEEDDRLRENVKKNGTKNWYLIASNMPGRNCKQCRERWVNILDPQLNTQNWDSDEDILLLKQHILLGNSWAKISKNLPGRSPNAVKNRFYLLERNHIAIPTTMEMLEKEIKSKDQKALNESETDDKQFTFFFNHDINSSNFEYQATFLNSESNVKTTPDTFHPSEWLYLDE